MTTTASNTSNTAGDGATERLSAAAQQAGDAAQRAADTVAGVAGEVTARFPDAANSTRDAFEEANRMVRSGSDETLKIVGALSLGFAAGLLIGGANRLLVIVAAAPAALIGSALLERMNTAPRSSKPVQRG